MKLPRPLPSAVIFCIYCVACAATSLAAGTPVAANGAKSNNPTALADRKHVVQLNGHGFTLPEGFEIELAASSALAPRPITADFDEQGRLYVADSSGTNED